MAQQQSTATRPNANQGTDEMGGSRSANEWQSKAKTNFMQSYPQAPEMEVGKGCPVDTLNPTLKLTGINTETRHELVENRKQSRGKQ